MSEIEVAIIATGLALGLVLVGELIARNTPLLRRVAMPGAVLGGCVGLLLGPQVTGWISQQDLGGLVYEQLADFPSIFINGVFACLLLGKRIQGVSSLWRRARAPIVMGHVYAWGQYVVGIGAYLLVLAPLFDVDHLAAATIAIGFQGGHGTSAGLTESFVNLGFPEGKTIAFAVATFGIVAGAIGGPVLAAALKKRHRTNEDSVPLPESQTTEESKDEQKSFGSVTGELSLHLALVAVITALGWGLLKGVESIERAVRGGLSDGGSTFTAYIPLFSVVLLAGMAVQIVMQSMGWDRFFRRSQFNSIAAFSLDMVILGALATLSLATVGDYLGVISVLCAAGLAWNLLVFFLLGPRVYPKPWHAYGLGDLGGGTATTASGLLLVRIADPDQRTGALRAYSEKQPLYEPLMGGGLVTASALPALASLGPLACFAITAVVLAFWLALAIRLASQAEQ